jgi:hypothetical protein
MLATLPPLWLDTLAMIRDGNRPIFPVVFTPGGRRVVNEMVATGLLDYSYNGRFCTFTPWCAERLGVVLYEQSEESHPRWTTIERVEAIEQDREPYQSLGESGHFTGKEFDRIYGKDSGATDREWFTETDGTPSTPLTDEWGREVVLFGAAVTRDEDQRRQLKQKRKARKAG